MKVSKSGLDPRAGADPEVEKRNRLFALEASVPPNNLTHPFSESPGRGVADRAQSYLW